MIRRWLHHGSRVRGRAATVLALGVWMGCGDDADVADPPAADASVADASRELDAKAPSVDASLDGAKGDASACGLDQGYKFARVGGNALYHDAYTLKANGELTKQRADTGRAGPNDAGILRQCVVMLPACGSDAVDPGDLTDALVEVTAVWGAEPNLFGIDPRPYDGQVLVIAREDGKVLELGDPCGDSPDCRPITPTLDTLEKVFGRLVQETAENPACADL